MRTQEYQKYYENIAKRIMNLIKAQFEFKITFLQVEILSANKCMCTHHRTGVGIIFSNIVSLAGLK